VRATPNQVTDEEAWLARNGLRLPVYAPGGREVRSMLESLQTAGAPVWGPAKVFDAGASRFFLFGDPRTGDIYLAAVDPRTGAFKYGFDFSAYDHPPSEKVNREKFTHQELRWAVEEGGILYVSTGHRTYAKDSKRLNAYITAIDLKTKTVRWRSPALVANAENFLVIGDEIVTGYGFTAEPDYLYRLRRGDGRVLGRVKLKSAPEYILEKDGLLYVRCYDTDAVYKVAAP
jgi:outer membrane protein assembly factor BamB